MTLEELIEKAVYDAVLETAFDKPAMHAALRDCVYQLKTNTRKRVMHPLVFNKMRELLKRRKPR